MRGPLRPIRVIFRKDLLDILRDRRAVFFAFVVPIALYPVLFLSFGALSPERFEEQSLRIACSGDCRGFLPYLAGENVIVAADETGSPESAVRRKRVDLFLAFPEAGGLADASVRVTLHYSSTSRASEAARRRVLKSLEEYSDSIIRERFAGRSLALDPEQTVSVEALDVSSPEETSSASLGRILPFLLVFLLLTGGSFAALDIVAGEKERGTLETLYIHPIPARSIVQAKFLVVLFISLVSLGFNVLGMVVCWSLGILPAGFGASASSLPSLATLGIVLALTAPLAVFTSAVLLALSSYAGSFREAQTYLLPLTLVALIAVLLASAPQVTLSTAVAVVPISNVALAVRQALEGRLELAGFALVFGSSSLYAWAALRKASSLLQREDVVLGLEPPSLETDAGAEARARRAIFFGCGMILFLYFAASWVQAKDLHAGLLITLWVFVLVPALLYPVITRSPFRETLGLRRGPPGNYLLAPAIAVSTLVIVGFYAAVQGHFLPFPSELEEAFRKLFEAADISPAFAIFLFAVSPGICEELLWRGAFQGGLEPRGKPLRTVVMVGIFFGVFHMDAYRLVPTALVGLILAIVRHRSGSIFPCILIHMMYNAGLLGLFVLETRGEAAALRALLETPLAAAVSLGILVIALRTVSPSPLPLSPLRPLENRANLE